MTKALSVKVCHFITSVNSKSYWKRIKTNDNFKTNERINIGHLKSILNQPSFSQAKISTGRYETPSELGPCLLIMFILFGILRNGIIETSPQEKLAQIFTFANVTRHWDQIWRKYQ